MQKLDKSFSEALLMLPIPVSWMLMFLKASLSVSETKQIDSSPLIGLLDETLLGWRQCCHLEIRDDMMHYTGNQASTGFYESLNHVLLFPASDCVKLLANSDTTVKRNWLSASCGFRAGSVWLPGQSIPPICWFWLQNPPLYVDTMSKSLWCLLVLQLSAPPSLNAKCRVCEDMQVARCLCNFPPAPFGKASSSEQQGSRSLLLSNSVSNSEVPLDDLETLATLHGRRPGAARRSWPLSGWRTPNGSPGFREHTGGVLRMFWQLRIAVYL